MLPVVRSLKKFLAVSHLISFLILVSFSHCSLSSEWFQGILLIHSFFSPLLKWPEKTLAKWALFVNQHSPSTPCGLEKPWQPQVWQIGKLFPGLPISRVGKLMSLFPFPIAMPQIWERKYWSFIFRLVQCALVGTHYIKRQVGVGKRSEIISALTGSPCPSIKNAGKHKHLQSKPDQEGKEGVVLQGEPGDPHNEDFQPLSGWRRG